MCQNCHKCVIITFNTVLSAAAAAPVKRSLLRLLYYVYFRMRIAALKVFITEKNKYVMTIITVTIVVIAS